MRCDCLRFLDEPSDRAPLYAYRIEHALRDLEVGTWRSRGSAHFKLVSARTCESRRDQGYARVTNHKVTNIASSWRRLLDAMDNFHELANHFASMSCVFFLRLDFTSRRFGLLAAFAAAAEREESTPEGWRS